VIRQKKDGQEWKPCQQCINDSDKEWVLKNFCRTYREVADPSCWKCGGAGVVPNAEF